MLKGKPNNQIVTPKGLTNEKITIPSARFVAPVKEVEEVKEVIVNKTITATETNTVNAKAGRKKKTKEPTKVLGFRVDEELMGDAQKVAKKKKVSLTDLIKEEMLSFIEKPIVVDAEGNNHHKKSSSFKLEEAIINDFKTAVINTEQAISDVVESLLRNIKEKK